jgi:hypothetical protein
MDNEKINLPGGLCVHRHEGCGGFCYCCLTNGLCYTSIYDCKIECVSTSDIVVTTIPPSFVAPFPA